MSDIIGTVLDGKYEITRLLGEGGMGAVYEATHKLIGRRLAVKFLHPQYAANEEVLTRFQREAQAAAAIGHENIIEVTDMGTTEDGSPYIVLEFLDGQDVRELLESETALPPTRAASIMCQALSALQSAHDAGIIHRDLKPENIYLITKGEREDYVKLLDFGISKFRSLEGDGAKGLTQTGTVLGTPYYMSPEQARGDQNLSSKSDIYAMGVILFQMLTGQLPFDAPNYNALLIKILTEDPPDPAALNPDLPEELVETVKAAMNREVDLRYDTCIEFRERLIKYLPGGEAANYSTSIGGAPRSATQAALGSGTQTPLEMTRSGGIATGKKKLPLVIGGAAAAVVALVVGAVLLLGEEKEAPKPAPVPVAAPKPEPKVEPKPEPEPEKPGKIKLRVTAFPADAKIKVDGEAKIGNPINILYPEDDKTHIIEVTAEDHQTVTEQIRFDRDQSFSYRLKEVVEDSKPQRRGGGSHRRAKKKEEPKSEPKAKPAGKPKRKPRRKIDDDDPWG